MKLHEKNYIQKSDQGIDTRSLAPFTSNIATQPLYYT